MILNILLALVAVFALVYCIRISFLQLASGRGQGHERYERCYERVPARSRGTLNWSTVEGLTESTPIKAVNVSIRGALVHAHELVPSGSVVHVHFTSFRLMTTAVVRHCTPHGYRFLIGLEFRHPLMAADPGSWQFVVRQS